MVKISHITHQICGLNGDNIMSEDRSGMWTAHMNMIPDEQHKTIRTFVYTVLGDTLIIIYSHLY